MPYRIVGVLLYVNSICKTMSLLLKLWVVVWLAEKKLNPFIYSTCCFLCVCCGEACWNFNVLFSSYTRGRIQGRDWDKCLKSFFHCCSQSPLLRDFNPSPPPPRTKVVWNWLYMETSGLKTRKIMPRKPQRNCTLMNSASGVHCTVYIRETFFSFLQCSIPPEGNLSFLWNKNEYESPVFWDWLFKYKSCCPQRI